MEIEKTMEFILGVQARLEASVEKHDERLAKIEASIQKHDEQIAKHGEQIGAVTDLVGRLARAEIRLVERTEGLAERMAAGFQDLRELHADTQYKLNALIATVDKLVRRDGHKRHKE